MTGIFRIGYWPGPPPQIGKRVMCSDCRYSSYAEAGWQWDRCHHPKADLGCIVRNDQVPKCYEIRNSSAQCGIKAKWFEPRHRADTEGGRP